MSLFQCNQCGCCDNTALSWQGFKTPFGDTFDWTGIEEREGMRLCSACGPAKFKDGTSTDCGKWHDKFPRVFLPLGMFRTARNGNLEHVDNGDQDFRKYALTPKRSEGTEE